MGRRKPQVPGRVPDDQFSPAAFRKLREELEELKNLPSPATAPNAAARGPLNTLAKRRDTEDAQKGIFSEYVRDFTQSAYDEARRRRGPDDFDLGHNQKNLTTNSRHTSLNDECLFRANPIIFVENQADLTQNHGAWFRVKTAQDKAKKRQEEKEKEKALGSMPRKKNREKQSPLVWQLKELQVELKGKEGQRALPKPMRLKKTSRRSFEDVGSDDGDQEDPTKKAIFNFLQWALMQFGSLQEAFKAIDVNNNDGVTEDEFIEACKKKNFLGDAWEVYDALNVHNKGEISLKEFVAFKPYLHDFLEDLEEKHLTQDSWQPTLEDVSSPSHDSLRDSHHSHSSPTARGRISVAASLLASSSQSFAGNKLIERYHLMVKERNVAQIKAEEQKKKSSTKRFIPVAGLPNTCSLTIFRNADKHHTGRPLFLKTTPPSLASLFEICDRVCPPVLGTVKALLDRDLRPVESVQDLYDGAVYLVKGPEVKLHPPSAFWDESIDKGHKAKSFQKALSSDSGFSDTQDSITSLGKPKVGKTPLMKPLTRKQAPVHHATMRMIKEAEEVAEVHELEDARGHTAPAGSRDLRSMTPSLSSAARSRTMTPGWSPSKRSLHDSVASVKASTPSDPRPLVLFQSRRDDPMSRSRDREWGVYECARGNVIGNLDLLESAGSPYLRSVQSTPELQLPSCWSTSETKSGKVDKATITSRCTTPELQMPWDFSKIPQKAIPMQQIDDAMFPGADPFSDDFPLV